MTAVDATEQIARCDECGHPWTVHSLDGIIMGELGPVIAALRDYDRKQRLGQL